MLIVRRWVSRHPRLFEILYQGFESVLLSLHPLFRRIGYQRLDPPAAAVEKVVKGFLFDTQMCGSCTLGATGMVCPMNCPKSMRNGPCGGVRANGHCEVKPDMPCVWVDAYSGSRRMKHGERIREIQAAVDHREKNTSSWLREVRRKAGGNAQRAQR
jgi:Methylene-tetrahydrofolate reductase C terminal